MKAVVMAGGEGSRLRPLTIQRPKPMVPVVNKSVMAHIIDLLKQHGIVDIVVTVQYLANEIQEAFGDGEAYGVNIQYSLEETPLGTGGSVKNAQEWLDDTFLIISGDAVTDFDLTAIIDYHKQKKAMATLTLYRVPNPLEYGVVILDENGQVQQFQEKPSWGEVFSDSINTGIYVLEPKALDYFPKNKVFDFSQDLFPLMLKNGDPIFGYVASGYWTDIGNIQEYMRACADILYSRVRLAEPIGQRLGEGIYAGEDVEIAPDARLYGPIYLGRGVKIKGGVDIHGPTVIDDDTIVDTRAVIERSIVWRNCYIGERSEMRGAIICRQCNLKSGVMVSEGVVIGDGTTVSDSVTIHPGVKIWPNKHIDTGAIIKSSLIWGSQARRVLFSRFGVTGLVNVDVTPEFAAKLGAAYGATLPKGSLVYINRDPHRTPRMIKRAMVAVTQGGTSTRVFAGARYLSGGKTGTAQAVTIGQKEKYNASKMEEHQRDHALYIAFAPADAPRIAIAAIVENVGFGAAHAAPIVRRAFDYWLLSEYPSEEDIAAVRKGQAAAPIGKPRRVDEVPLTDQSGALMRAGG